MSSFYAYDFMFDDIPSHRWDLKIITFEDGGLFNGVGSSDVNIITQRVLRKSKTYYLGRTQEPVLEFTLTFGTMRPISGYDRDVISSWLFGRSTYKRLYILQDDLNGAYFNCFLTKPEPLYIGGLNYAFTCTVTCDSPWAYIPSRVISGSFVYTEIVNGLGGGTPIWNNTFDIYNFSSEDDYLYPEINLSFGEIVFAEMADHPYTTMTFTNTTDNPDRHTILDGVFGYQSFNLNNDLQIITNDSTTFPQNLALRYFNNNWFRLVPKNNIIDVSTVGIYNGTYNFVLSERMKIGG